VKIKKYETSHYLTIPITVILSVFFPNFYVQTR